MTHILAEQSELVAWGSGSRCSSAQCLLGDWRPRRRPAPARGFSRGCSARSARKRERRNLPMLVQHEEDEDEARTAETGYAELGAQPTVAFFDGRPALRGRWG